MKKQRVLNSKIEPVKSLSDNEFKNELKIIL